MTLTKFDLTQIRQVVKEEVRDELKAYPTRDEIKKEFNNVNRNIKTSVNYLDKEHLKLDKRITKVENHLGITASPLTI